MTPSRKAREREFAKGNMVCFYCGEKMKLKRATVDHVHPKSKGGERGDNIKMCCKKCNSYKSNKTIAQFVQSLKDKIRHSVEPVDYYETILSNVWKMQWPINANT